MTLAVASTQTGSTFSISPNTLYYIALYAVVIIVRFFKLRKEEEGKTWGKHNWKQVFHVGLEIVYTASGLVVLLLTDLRDYTPFIIVAYVILVLVSSQIESMEERFSDRAVFGTHFVILVAVLTITVMYFEVVHPNAKTAVEARSSGPHHYTVMVPYQDVALREHVGAAFGARQLVFISEIEAKDESSARLKAREELKAKVSPFESKRRRVSQDDIVVYLDQVLVQRRD